MTEKSLVFECMACHFKWTTPSSEELQHVSCPECGKTKVILKKGITPDAVMRDGADRKE